MSEKNKRLQTTVDQAVDMLLSELSIEEKTKIANMSKDNLINLHFSLGMSIRNEFRLWTDNKELLESCRLLSGKQDLNVDDASSKIVEDLWKKLQETDLLRVLK